MSGDLSPVDTAKSIAAERAVEFVKDGMSVGLGTGSTAAWMVRRLGEKIRNEKINVVGVPTSRRTAQLARDAGVAIVGLDERKPLDLTIDGADEVDPDLNLIKGGGGALRQEKIVALASKQVIIIADDSKRVERLGAFPLPVEVEAACWKEAREGIEAALSDISQRNGAMELRMSGDRPFLTYGNNHIIDLHLERIDNARRLSQAIGKVPGVVENGLFIDICDILIVGRGDRSVEVIDRGSGAR